MERLTWQTYVRKQHASFHVQLMFEIPLSLKCGVSTDEMARIGSDGPKLWICPVVGSNVQAVQSLRRWAGFLEVQNLPPGCTTLPPSSCLNLVVGERDSLTGCRRQ